MSGTQREGQEAGDNAGQPALAFGRAAPQSSPRPDLQGTYAGMDLSGVLSTLESHWVVLEAELAEIRKDHSAMRTFTRKYGEGYWNRSLATLKKLRVEKETYLKEYVPAESGDTMGAATSHARAHAHAHAQVLRRGSCSSLAPLLAGSSSRWSCSTCTSNRAATSVANSRSSRLPSRRRRNT